MSNQYLFFKDDMAGFRRWPINTGDLTGRSPSNVAIFKIYLKHHFIQG
jgi:hypothetical protein